MGLGRMVDGCGNRALADEPDGGSALGVLSSLAKSLGGEHGRGAGVSGANGNRRVCAVASGKVDRCDVDDAVAAYSPRDDVCPSWILERNEQG